MDEAGEAGEAEAERPKPPSPWRGVWLSLAAAAVFGTILGAYIVRSAKLPEAPLLVATSDAVARGPDALEAAQRVATTFVAALRDGDFAGAYAQMARPYRDSATFEVFRTAWMTRLLAGPQSIRLTRAHSSATPIDGKYVPSATFTATGVLVCAAGALELSLTFLREDDEVHVLAVYVSGVPIVQGLGPAAR